MGFLAAPFFLCDRYIPSGSLLLTARRTHLWETSIIWIFPRDVFKIKTRHTLYIYLEVKDVKIRVDNSELNTFSGTWKSSKLFFLWFFHISCLIQLTNTNIKMNKTSQLSRAINCWKSEVSFSAAEVTPSKLWFAHLYSYVLTLRGAHLFL